MPPRLRQHALARVDQDHGQVSGGRARHHIACVLLVPRRVGDNELALLRSEEAIGDVDGDALLTLRGEAVHQQREVDILALRAHAPTVGFERSELILEDQLGVVEQPPDQRRLAVVHRPAGDEAKQRLVLVPIEIGLNVLGDQRVGAVGGARRGHSLTVTPAKAGVQREAGLDTSLRRYDGGRIRNTPPASSSPCWRRRRPCRSRGPDARRWW